MSVFRHLVSPETCPACDVTAFSFCGPCRADLEPWDPVCCLRCGADRLDRCVCSRLPEEVGAVVSCWKFQGAITDVIEYAKYRREIWRLERLKAEAIAWLASQGNRSGTPSTVTAVPPTRQRLRQRGLDLASTLARWCGRCQGVRVDLRLLRRKSQGRSRQATHGRSERFEAVKDAFVARRSPKRVILVDDVITTGATVSVCAQALVGAGAREIRILTLARTPSWEFG